MNNNSSDLLGQCEVNQADWNETVQTGRNSGRIYFFLAYDWQSKQLDLNVIKARRLRGRNEDLLSTFVRADIGPKLNATFSTDIVENNPNPDYMTETRFYLNPSEFSSNALKLTVYEVDKENSSVPIGTIFYPLEHLLIAQRAKGHLIWRDLLPGKSQRWRSFPGLKDGLFQFRVCVSDNDESS